MHHRIEGLLRRAGLRLLGLTLLASAFASPSAAQIDAPADGVKPIFLVADVQVGEGVPIDKDAARDVLATRFGRLKDKLEVRSMSEAKASIDAVAMGQLMGSGNDEDLARLETYMQVDRLVIGSVKQVAGVIDVQVKVFNMKEGVTEVAFARRMGKGADRALVLTLLDTLADSLLAWTIEHYTDGSMSAEATAMANKKLPPRPKAPVVVDEPSAFGGLGVAGGVLAGGGVGLLAAGLTGVASNDGAASDTDVAFLAIGGGLAAVGATIVVIDLVAGE